MGPPWVGFFFRVEPPTILYFMFGVCFLLSGAMLDAIFTYGGSPIGVCTIAALWSFPCHAYVQHGDGHQSTPGMHRMAAPSTLLSLMLLNQLFPSHPNYMVGHTALGAWQSHPIPLPSLYGWEGLLFQVWFNPMTQSTLNLQWALNLMILMW